MPSQSQKVVQSKPQPQKDSKNQKSASPQKVKKQLPKSVTNLKAKMAPAQATPPKQADGDKRNKATLKANLEFNVSNFKRWLGAHYQKSNCHPTFLGMHSMVTACVQVVCQYLVSGASEKVSKNKGGMYELTSENLRWFVETDPAMNETYGQCLRRYDDNMNYTDNLCVSRKELSAFLEKYAFNGGNTSAQLSQDGYNMLAYVLVYTCSMLADSSLAISRCGRKSNSVHRRHVATAAQIHYRGRLLKSIVAKTDEVERLIGKVKETANTKDSDSAESEDKTPATKKGSAKSGTKGSSKAQSKDDSEEEESDEDEQEDDAEESEESEEEESDEE